MANFWKELKRPFFVLAPMEDVTDTVFRQIIASIAKPDVFFTEFTNVDAVIHGDTQRLRFTEIEHPIVAQIWGTDPQKFCAATKIVADLGFDGIDINFGCPQRKIIKTGSCAALIGQNQVVAEIIAATRKGAQSLPISVKTRLGVTQIATEDWIGFLLSQNLTAITIHGRTAAEKSDVPARWDEIARAVSFRNKAKSKTLIIGNGDVNSLADATKRIAKYGVDGVMIGRGILHNPALFAQKELDKPMRLLLLQKHIDLFAKIWGKDKHFVLLKKYIKAYINGFAGSAQIREELMQAHDLAGLKSNAIILRD